MEEIKNNKEPAKRDFDTDMEWLKQYGLTRDPTIGMTTGGHINAH